MKRRWIVRWDEGHRTPWGFQPCLATYDYDPKTCAGDAVPLMIGFASVEDCQHFIDQHLSHSAAS